MRYRELADYYSAFTTAREAVKREWKLSGTTVMCVEVDLGAASALKALPLATQPASPPSFIRVSYFDTVGLPVSLARLSSAEIAVAKEMQLAVNRWMCGEIEALPTSTSTRLADRFRR